MVFMSSVIIRLRNMERMGTLHVYQSTQNRIADSWVTVLFPLRKSILCGFRLSRPIFWGAG